MRKHKMTALNLSFYPDEAFTNPSKLRFNGLQPTINSIKPLVHTVKLDVDAIKPLVHPVKPAFDPAEAAVILQKSPGQR